MFTQNDLKQLEQKGINLIDLEKQIANFKHGFPYSDIVEAATISKGIKCFNKKEAGDLLNFYNKNCINYNILKFVPASGAATRMFKSLFDFYNSEEDNSKNKNIITDKDVQSFFEGLSQFAFYDDLKAVMNSANYSLEDAQKKGDYKLIIDFLLNEKGLNYSNLPKALLKFHKYNDFNRTAIEEHLVESALYGKNSENRVAIHFTVSPEHAEKILELINNIKDKYEKRFNVIYELTFSVQKGATDTIAVDENNEPIRNNDNLLMFRPSGHGALIENLNERNEDIIFIKNIDNVVTEKLLDETVFFKKVLGGYLISTVKQIFEYLEILEVGNLTKTEIKKIYTYAKDKLLIDFTPNFANMDDIEKIDMLYTKLNRPVRVCGMVKNEGEPGGGPFFVKNNLDETSLQIVEKSQIDTNNKEQSEILASSTHFNPVDLVCFTTDFNEQKFNLANYIDYQTGFIALKSHKGKVLKAQERPGLWNGAMADWITIFVETPLITFNPVKTINDLLREEHLTS